MQHGRNWRFANRGKVSEALLAMVAGLREAASDPKFKIDMNSYGRNTEDVCFGCAATCAIQNIAGIHYRELLPKENVCTSVFLAGHLCDSEETISYFESAINDVRSGYIGMLIDFMGAKLPKEYRNKWISLGARLENGNRSNWPANLLAIEYYANELKEAGY